MSIVNCGLRRRLENLTTRISGAVKHARRPGVYKPCSSLRFGRPMRVKLGRAASDRLCTFRMAGSDAKWILPVRRGGLDRA